MRKNLPKNNRRGNRFAIWAAGASLLVASVPLFAHHSFAAEFDEGKSITLSGTVTKVEWLNPHVHFYLDVKDENGKVTVWDFETASPNGLSRQGWTRNALKAGDNITVQGVQAKDGSHLVSAGMVTLADGRKVFGGSGDAGSAGSKPSN
jgi:hypothetical protein